MLASKHIERHEVAIGVSREDDIASSRKCAAIGIAEVRKFPPGFGGERIESFQSASRTDFGFGNVDAAKKVMAGAIGLWGARKNVALIRCGEIEEPSDGAVGGCLPIGHARSAGTNARAFGRGFERSIDDRLAIGGDSRSPSNFSKRLGSKELAVGPIENIEKAIAVGKKEKFAGLAAPIASSSTGICVAS